MLWFAIHLPLLSLEAFCATLPAGAAERPAALLAEHRIAAVNAAAARCGIQSGHRRATAMALAADLLLGQADPARDAQALQAVAHAALAFTPAVAIDGSCGAPDTALLEVAASLRYFGGATALLGKLRQALAPLAHHLQIAAAPTALGAVLLARWKAGFEDGPHCSRLPALQALLDDLPVWLLGPGRQYGQVLQGMGLQRLADLRRLPRTGLARRFGAQLLDDLDRAYGRRPDPRPWIALPAAFDSRLELFARADGTEQVLHGAAVLLARLVVWARAQQARIEAFVLVMHHEPRHRGEQPPATELRIELAAPSADAEHLQLLLRERLARCQLAAPTLELRLCCRQIVHAAPPSGELFPSRSNEGQGLTRLLERLRARLGDERVQQLLPVPDHRPERAGRWQRVSATADVEPDARPTPLPLHRPAWLLPDPQPLHERGPLPLLEGRPLQLLAGPERIEAGWWDGALATRDYFIAQAADGALVWLYRARLPRMPEARSDGPGSASEPSGWFLHGRFG